MNPLYFAIATAVIGKQRRCPACGTLQVIEGLDTDGRCHCKQCGHKFTKEELKREPRMRN